jgi:hypothetical protein
LRIADCFASRVHTQTLGPGLLATCSNLPTALGPWGSFSVFDLFEVDLAVDVPSLP